MKSTHVKGHQTGSNLLWEAKLNNRADELATEARQNITTHQAHKQIDLFPAAKIYLLINGKLITRGIAKAIQNEYTQKANQENMKK
eukprot:1933103-Ditylum_brightwellii.AAC.1